MSSPCGSLPTSHVSPTHSLRVADPLVFSSEFLDIKLPTNTRGVPRYTPRFLQMRERILLLGTQARRARINHCVVLSRSSALAAAHCKHHQQEERSYAASSGSIVFESESRRRKRVTR